MKLLLDTHVVLWWTHDSRRLSQTARELVGDPRHDVLLSAVVAWEIAIKRALGTLKVRPGLVAELLADGGAAELAVSVAHATEVERLPMHHRDPFDRMLVAQARVEGAVLVSSDEALRKYDVPVSW
ncbi:MAG: type II toxin-antitoxin system VapC family toxin [Solirubrobacteraceae bacterium]